MVALAKVSVVIPSTGRDSLLRAVNSALLQTDVEVEVVVVLNGTDRTFKADDTRVKVMRLEGVSGQGVARQAGVEAARHPYTALLDDDDHWKPTKLATQLSLIRAFGLKDEEGWIATCGLLAGPAGHEMALPRRNPTRLVTRPDEFLFDRSWFRRDRGEIQASTLLFPTWLGTRVRFDSLREIHTDWGWVLRTTQTLSIPVVMAGEYLSYFDTGTLASATKRSKGAASMAWAKEYLRESSPRVRADFLINISARMYARDGDEDGYRDCLALAHAWGSPSLLSRANTVRFRRHLSRNRATHKS